MYDFRDALICSKNKLILKKETCILESQPPPPSAPTAYEYVREVKCSRHYTTREERL